MTTDYEVRQWNASYYQVRTQTDESGKVTETWTDGWGRKVRTISDPGSINAETIFEYDELDQLTEVTAPNNTVTTYDYNGKGEVVAKATPDADGDGDNDPTDETATGSPDVQYIYDRAGNLRFVQDAVRASAGEVVFYTYDSQGRKTAEGVASATFSNLDGDQSYGFESTNSNLRGAWAYDSKPSTSAFPWDQFSSQLTGTSVSNTTGRLVARAWRVDDGNSSQMGSNPWQLEVLSYDSEGRVADKWIWTGNNSSWDTHLAYDYNRQGDITKRQVTVGSETLYQFYEYNQRGLLSKVFANTADSQPSQAEVTYSYTATGAIDNIDYRGSKDADYGYTIRDWVHTINNVGSPGGNFAADYDYTDNGNVDIATFHNPQVQSGGGPATYQWAFGYDGLSRLTGANFEGSSSKFDVDNLTYDDAGNITGLQRNDETGSLIDNLSYSYSGSNRLQSVTDGVGATGAGWDAEDASFGYDAGGNLTSQSGKLDDVAYEHRNRPTYFDLSNGSDVRAFYNADGQRVLKEASGGAWSFYVTDGQQTLAVVDNSGFGHFNLVGNEVFGRYTDSGARRYYITDHLGSTRAVVDNSGNVLETFDYYPFGAPMPGRYSQSGNTLERFTGKERDNEANLNLDYFGARYYDTALGRWHSVDPKAKDYPAWSPYNYTMNNPMIFIDPDGQSVGCPEEPCGLIDRIVNYFTNSGKEFNSIDYTEQVATGVGEDLAKGAQKMPGQLKEGAFTAGDAVVDGTASVSDAVSGSSTGAVGVGLSLVAAGGAVSYLTGSPLGASMISSGLEITGTAVSVGTSADVTSAVAKGIDAAAFDGSTDRAINQGIRAGVSFVGGKVLRATKAGALRYAQTATQATRSVPVSEGIKTTTTAVTDATKVATPLIMEKIIRDN